MRLERETSKSGRVLERRRSERVDSLIDDIEMDQEAGRKMGARTGVFVPMMLRDRAIGVITATTRKAPTRGSRTRTCASQKRSQRGRPSRSTSPSASRPTRCAGSSSAQELERQRLARELHDETGQALTSILLGLKSVEDVGDPEDLAEATGELRELVVATLQDVRRLAVELRPKALDDFGLVPAIERLVGNLPRADRDRGRPRAAARERPPAARDRDDPLPDHAGGADERGQARPGQAREHRAHAPRRDGRGRDRGRRPRVRPKPAANGLGPARNAGARRRSSTGGSRSSPRPVRALRSRSRCRSRDDPRPRRRRPRGRPLGPPPRARGRGRHRGRRRGGRSSRGRVRGARAQAGRDPDGRRHAGRERDRGHSGGPEGGAGREGADAVHAGRPALRARGVLGRARAATC